MTVHSVLNHHLKRNKLFYSHPATPKTQPFGSHHEAIYLTPKGPWLDSSSAISSPIHRFTEATEGKKETDEIQLKDLDAGAFEEFLGVIYPTCYPITDANVISLFRIADRYDVKRVIVDCEYYLMGVNGVPWFDKLKLAVDLNRDQLKERLIRKMTWDDFETIEQHENKKQLRMDVLQALIDEHFPVCRP
ncbi:Protein BATH-36 [Aphelenchoides avenae]|nr:Protein BATH-36 [Aphelenchus avenae]